MENEQRRYNNAYAELVAALRRSLDCRCTVKERDSGHRTGCHVPESADLLRKLGETE